MSKKATTKKVTRGSFNNMSNAIKKGKKAGHVQKKGSDGLGGDGKAWCG